MMTKNGGFFTQESLDRLKDKIDIADVITSEGIQLKKNGKDLLGLCPFHQDTTPSLTVSTSKGFYHCFACEAHGDAIDFLMETGKRSFSDVALDLAKRYSVTLDRVQGDGTGWAAQKARQEAQDRLRSLVADAVGFYHQQLYAPSGQPAREHMKRRGMGRAIADKYQMGWAGGGLVSHLLMAGYSPDEITAAGVATNKEGELVDFLWNRLVIPICDDRGRAIALAGRVLDDREPKYLNTRDSSIFHKTSTLYDLHHAKPLLSKGRSLAVVEGYFDAIALNEAGIPAGAVMGVALSAELATRTTRLAPLVMVMDRDKAGIRAVRRLSEDQAMLSLLLSGRLPLRVMEVPDGCKDPDDAVRAHGPAVINQGLVDAPDYLSWLIAADGDRHNAAAINDRQPIRDALTDLLSKIPSPASRLERLRQMADRFAPGDDEARRAIVDESRQRRRSSPVATAQKSTGMAVLRPGEAAELAIARVLLHQPSPDWELITAATAAIADWDCYWPVLWDAIWDGLELVDVETIEGLPEPIARSLTEPSAFDRVALSSPSETISQAWRVLEKTQAHRDRQQQLEALMQELECG